MTLSLVCTLSLSFVSSRYNIGSICAQVFVLMQFDPGMEYRSSRRAGSATGSGGKDDAS